MAERRFKNDFEVEFALEEEHRRQLEAILTSPEMSRLPFYYIFATSRCDHQNIIRTRFVTTKAKPPKLLNSICYKVDNVRGEIRVEWVAPYDVPIPDCLVMPESSDERIIRTAKDLPVVF